VNFWLNCAYAKTWIAENKSQQVGQVNLSAGKLRDMPIPIPPLCEQQEISRLLSEHFDTTETGARSAEQSGNDSTALRQSILKAAFEGRLVPQDPADEPHPRYSPACAKRSVALALPVGGAERGPTAPRHLSCRCLRGATLIRLPTRRADLRFLGAE
jgi:type I restriction enzyme S subunit